MGLRFPNRKTGARVQATDFQTFLLFSVVRDSFQIQVYVDVKYCRKTGNSRSQVWWGLGRPPPRFPLNFTELTSMKPLDRRSWPRRLLCPYPPQPWPCLPGAQSAIAVSAVPAATGPRGLASVTQHFSWHSGALTLFCQQRRGNPTVVSNIACVLTAFLMK